MTAHGPGIESFLIHDGGSSVHVCNSKSAHLYTKIRDAHDDEYLRSGTGTAKIESWGRIETAFESPNGLVPIFLENVAFVGSFLTSLVSQSVLERKGVHFDTGGPRLYKDGATKFFLHCNGGHYTFTASGLPHNYPRNAARVLATTVDTTANISVKERSAKDWHTVMAHVSGEAIRHLEKSSADVKLSDSAASVPKTNQCETCALTKSHQIISRSSKKTENNVEPFSRISVDLMQFEPALNGHEWATHIACMSTDFNLVRTNRTKTGSREFILDSIALIKRRFKHDVVFIRSDNEGAFSNAFKDELISMGISLEESAPDTPAQNGHAERKGKMLAIKARALRIEAGLPHYMWAEAFYTGCYIANRTPMEKHSWKTPFEMVTGNKPYLSHLRMYGCKAYVLKHHIPRKQKLEPRAHIGYLVGYDSTNIFRIWIPSRHKVIRSRDVLFDEQEIYDASHPPDLLHFLSKKSLGENEPYHITGEMRSALEELDIQDENISSSLFRDWFTEEHPSVEQTSSSKESLKDSNLPQTHGLLTPSETPPLMNNTSDSGTREEEDLQDISGLPSVTKRRRYHHSKVVPVTNKALRADTISGDLDTGNILPEGVKRQPKSSTRHDAYSTQLTSAETGSLEVFHNAFASFASSSLYRNRSFLSSTMDSVLAASETEYTRPTSRAHRDNLPPEPKNFKELAKHPYCEFFKTAMRTEIDGLKRKNTWKETPLDDAVKANKKPIPTMWVYKYKFDEQGWLIKFKARLVARGDLQHTDMDTYAATLAARLFRFLMAITAAFDLETRQYDAVNAFANSSINEPVFCKVPPGWTGGNLDILLLLQRTLYGLKQSPILWYKELSKTLIEFGLEPLSGIDCIYTNSYMIVFFFEDDICVLYDKRYTSQVDTFEADLFSTYEMKFLGEIDWFLGIRVTRDRASRKLWLCQDSYVDKLAAKFNISKTKTRLTPLPVEEILKFTGTASAQDILHFQQKVGSINFPAVITRPDIAHASSKLSEHLTNPSPHHLELVTRVIEYLVDTRTLSILFDGQVDLSREIWLVSSDASFADDLRTRFSSQGYAFKLFGGLIDWKANKQKTVTLSSTEAELLAVSQAAKETLWWSRLFDLIEFDPGHQVAIQCDNQ